MVSGISGSGNNWNNIQIESATVPVTAPQAGEVKSKAVVTDRLEEAASIKSETNSGVVLPDLSYVAPQDNTAVKINYDVAVIVEQQADVPTTTAEIKQWVKTLSLNKSQQKTAIAAFEATGNSPAARAALLDLLQSADFDCAKSSVKDALLAMAQFYPNETSLGNMAKLLTTSWFNALSDNDSQKAIRLIAVMSQSIDAGEVAGSKCYAYGAMESLLSGELAIDFSGTDSYPKVSEDKKTIIIQGSRIPAGIKADTSDFLYYTIQQSIPYQCFAATHDISDYNSSLTIYDLKDMDKEEGFKKLDRQGRHEVIKAVLTIHHDDEILTAFKNILNSTTFMESSPVVQNAVLAKLAEKPDTELMSAYRALRDADWFYDLGDAEKAVAMSAVLDITSQAAGNINLSERALLCEQKLALINGEIKVDWSVSPLSIPQVSAPAIQDGNFKEWSSLGLNKTQVAMINAALKGVKQPQTLTKSLLNLVQSRSFKTLPNATQTAVLAQCQYFNNAKAVDQIRYMTAADWFVNSSLDNQQRAAKSIGYIATVAQSNPGSVQETINMNSLTHLLSGRIPLSFVEIEDDPGSITLGYAMPNKAGIFINQKMIPGDNNRFVDNRTNRDAIVDTISHEVSHQVNKDVNQADYVYYQAEFRAWYVGFEAANGRVPTVQEAFDRSIDIINLYPSINQALFELPEERKQMLTFINQMIGAKNIEDIDTVDEIKTFLRSKLKNSKGPAPIPDPALNPDMDN